MLFFEWDENKARDNIRDHDGVSFEDAKGVFSDSFALDIEDSRFEEPRYVIAGRVQNLTGGVRYLVVAYTERGKNIRIISAREMTPAERRRYANAKR